jgi:hypothetical protein
MDFPMLLVRSDNADIVARSAAFGGEDSLDSRLVAGYQCVAHVGGRDDDAVGLEGLVRLLGVMGDVWHTPWHWNDARTHGVGIFDLKWSFESSGFNFV